MQLMYKEKKVQPITKKQIDYIGLLCKHHNICLEADLEKMTRSEASKFIDGIISKHGNMQY